MEAFVTQTHRAVLEVLTGPIKERKSGKFFNSTLIEEDTNNKNYLYPGMIVAELSDGSYYVPYSLGASYGEGSDDAIGILREFWDATLHMRIVAPVTEGTFIEDYCYILGGELGVVSDAVKTSLSHVQWK